MSEEAFGTPVSSEWIKIQQRTFTAWVNNHLRVRKQQVNDMQEDFEDGLLLISLLELISAKDLGKYNLKPKIRAQKLENCNTALQFVKSEGIKLVNIGSEDFVDKKLTLILGFIWTLILRYHIQKGGISASAKSDLLKWVQSKIPHKNVVNFTTSWQDGTSICELVEVLKPGQIDVHSLNPANRVENARLAEENAEKNMDIPMIIAPEDFVADIQDELSIMTYISYLRDYDKRENAGRLEEEKRKTVVPGESIAYGDGLSTGETNKEANFTIEARNCFGQKVDHGGDPFVVSIKGPKTTTVDCNMVDVGDGTYQCSYVPIVAGIHHITITLHNKGIKGNPWKANITRAEPDANTTVVEGPGIEPGVEAGVPTYFKIHAKDKAGNAVPVGGDPFTVKVTGPYGDVPHQLKDNNDGTYLVNYTANAPGPHKIEVNLVLTPVAKSPYHIDVVRPLSEPDPQQCEAKGPGLEPGLKTAFPTHFNIISKNRNGEVLQINPSTHVFSVEVISPDEAPLATKISGDNGTLKVEYTPKLPGVYRIDVVVHNAKETAYYDHIKDSTFKVTIGASAEGSTSEAYGPGLENGIKDTADTHFIVATKDIQGNPIKTGGEDVQVKIVGPKGETIPAEITDNGDGTYKVAYRPTGPGKHVITPTVRDENVKNAPFTVDVKAGASAGHSFVEGFTFKIRAVDTRGENRKDGGDDFKVEINGPDGLVQGVTVQDLKDGSYLVSYSLPKSGEYNVNATINGEHIKGSPWKQQY